ncbi:MAG: hypothetical protein M5U13_13115 [Thermoanaerobaculia bacterium]|nr:hypothetical protein [Thermoanaerobaculia bacterium]
MEEEGLRDRGHGEREHAGLPLGELDRPGAPRLEVPVPVEREQLDEPTPGWQALDRHRPAREQLHLAPRPLQQGVVAGQREIDEELGRAARLPDLGRHDQRRREPLAEPAEVVARPGGELGHRTRHRRQRRRARRHHHRVRPRGEILEHQPPVLPGLAPRHRPRALARDEPPQHPVRLPRADEQHRRPRTGARPPVSTSWSAIETAGRSRRAASSYRPPGATFAPGSTSGAKPGKRARRSRQPAGTSASASPSASIASGSSKANAGARPGTAQSRTPTTPGGPLPAGRRQEARHHPPGGEERHLQRRARALVTGRGRQCEDERHQPWRARAEEGLRLARHIEIQREPLPARLPDPDRHRPEIASGHPLDGDRGRIGDRLRRREEELHPRRGRRLWRLRGRLRPQRPSPLEDGHRDRHRERHEPPGLPHGHPPFARPAASPRGTCAAR